MSLRQLLYSDQFLSQCDQFQCNYSQCDQSQDHRFLSQCNYSQ